MLTLETTSDIPDDATADLEAELVALFGAPPKRRGMVLLSGTAPSWVSVLADLVSWQTVLKASVLVFCREIAKYAAGDVWKNTSKIAAALKTVGVEALRKLALALTRTRARLPKSSVQIGLSLDDLTNVQLSLPDTEEQVGVTLAIFVCKAEEINETLRGLATRTSAPIHLSLGEDGALVVSWLKAGEASWSTIRISPPDLEPGGQ